jgi:hypothetical protein
MNGETVAAIVRTTGGNFRLLNRVLTQMERIAKINGLDRVDRLLSKRLAKAWFLGSYDQITAAMPINWEKSTPNNSESIRLGSAAAATFFESICQAQQAVGSGIRYEERWRSSAAMASALADGHRNPMWPSGRMRTTPPFRTPARTGSTLGS